jgi:hypothetical protein
LRIMVYSSFRKFGWLAVFGVIFAISGTATYAQEETGAAEESTGVDRAGSTVLTDTIFYELHLSPEGVYGVDSSGREWEYDFTTQSFVEEIEGQKKTIRIYSPDTEELDRDLEILNQTLRDLDLPGRIETSRKYRGLQLGSVEVKEGEVVNGAIMAVGEVIVKGTVNGDVISYKRITVTSTGTINGDARAPEIVKMRDGVIAGGRIETDLPRIPEIPEIDIFRESSYTALTANLVILGSLLFFSLLAVTIASRPITRIKECLEHFPLKSFFVGFGFWLVLGPLMGLLILTIIGIPVAVFVLPMALIIAAVMGIIAFSQLVGHKSEKFLGGISGSQIKKVILGLLLLYLTWIFMSLFMISRSGVSSGFGVFFMVISIVIWSVVISMGVGAVIMTRFGTRSCRAATTGVKVGIDVGRVTPPPPSPPPLRTDDEGKKEEEK